MNKRLTTEEFIVRVKQFHPEYDYSKVNYVNSKIKVLIGCPKHGYINANPHSLLQGRGCWYCGQKSTHKKQRLTTEDFISKAKEVYPEYNYSKVNYVNRKIPVIIGCSKHGDFQITPENLFKSGTRGCHKCAIERMRLKNGLTTEEFIEKAKNKFPNYDYSRVKYINMKTKVIIGCPEHGYFLKSPSDLMQGKGCWDCRNKYLSDYFKDNNETFIKKAKNVHPEYNYSKVKYIDSQTKVILGCSKHGDFLMTPNNLLRGKGCPICGENSRIIKQSSTTEDFIKKAVILQPKYNYSKVNYINSQTKVIIGCSKHGDFLVTPNDFLCGGTGCPKCSESKGERAIRNWFEEHEINYIPQQRFKDLGRLSYDFYIPNFNLLIEYNGQQHYKLVSVFHKNEQDLEYQLKRDKLKKDYAERNGYKLLVIPYTEFDNIESILEKTIRDFTIR